MADAKVLWDEFIRESRKKMLEEITPEERVKGLTSEQLVSIMTPEQRAGVVELLKKNGTATSPRIEEPKSQE